MVTALLSLSAPPSKHIVQNKYKRNSLKLLRFIFLYYFVNQLFQQEYIYFFKKTCYNYFNKPQTLCI